MLMNLSWRQHDECVNQFVAYRANQPEMGTRLASSSRSKLELHLLLEGRFDGPQLFLSTTPLTKLLGCMIIAALQNTVRMQPANMILALRSLPLVRNGQLDLQKPSCCSTLLPSRTR